MKILQVCEYYQRLGGTEEYVLNVSSDLEKMGHEISMLYGRKTGSTLSVERRKECYFPAVSSAPQWSAALENKLEEFISLVDPDVVYLHNVDNYRLIEKILSLRPLVRFIHDHRLFCPAGYKVLRKSGAICGYKCGYQCFVNAYVNRCFPRQPLRALGLVRERLAALSVGRKIRTITASGYMRDCLVQNGFSRSQVEVIPYYCPDNGVKASGAGDFLLFAGRVWRQKGLTALFEALKILPENIKLVVAGDGEDLDEARKTVRELRLTERVVFKGMLDREELRAYYANCLLVAVPSLWPEPFGMVGIEAMASGKPVVAFNVGGVSEWLAEGVNGYAVAREDIAGFARKIMK
ncbi:MAG: glycosyltransferase family 4 protein, partial [Kiritimatiellae bacterium]|nr:glycosyltransferase family 4 protein [Kiritimatiellia bacterium]